MHNIDRTQGEYQPEVDALEANSFEFETDEWEARADIEGESPFNEVEEMELAAELLEITDEAELDQFLGKLIKKAGQAIGKFAKSSAGKALGGILKGAAKAALPILGTAAGGFFGGPAGAAIGGKPASGAGKLFGLELEGMSYEDQEFEVAKRFVRFAGTAAQKASVAPPTADPRVAAKSAVVAAARRHAPGLIRGGAMPPPPAVAAGSRCSGRWIRAGRKIVLLGV